MCQHHEGNAARRSVAQVLRSARLVQAAHREKALGQKPGRGVYRKSGQGIQVLDLQKKDYRPSGREADESVVAILKNRNVAERFAQLRASPHPQAQFMWAALRDMLHYCAVHLEVIAGNARDLDFAVRWGFGWNQGPFEIWQAAGWQQMARWIAEDIAAGRPWRPCRCRRGQPNQDARACTRRKARGASRSGPDKPRSTLPVYRRQPFPDRLISESADYGSTVFESDAVRMWTTGDDIAHRQLQDANACNRRGRAGWSDAGHRRVRARLQGNDPLADGTAIFGRRQPVRRWRPQDEQKPTHSRR